ncbi:MAG: hypothetical protein JOY61_22185 [Chloroflexi bacterium]|nr:hypothetical protein [Chloroflexota bacterium]
MEAGEKLTFALALTVRERAGDVGEDVLVRGTADQTVAELARQLAEYLGSPVNVEYGLRVERTGEQLRPAAAIGAVDLLEGDFVTLLGPRVVGGRRRPRWAEPDDAPRGSPPKVVPLRPRTGSS